MLDTPTGPRHVTSAKKRPRPAPYVKPKGTPGKLNPIWREHFYDDEDETGRGRVVEVPDPLRLYGEWRRVPGFPGILASDEGYIMTQGATRVRTPSQRKHTHYCVVSCNRRMQQVHLLVTRAFHGPAQAHHTSADHLGGMHLSPKERRSDNRACNLTWATHKEQRANQKKRRPNATGEPCVVWRVQGRDGGLQTSAGYMTPIGPELSYHSSRAAAAALGLSHRHLSSVFSDSSKLKTVSNKDGVRYTGHYAERDDSDLDGEEWKEHSSRLRVSNHGRIQTKHARGQRWGWKRFASEHDGGGYMAVVAEGKHFLVHDLVGTLFFIGPKPRDWFCFDHKDGDIYNNRIVNLRPVTREDNAVNRPQQRDFYIWKVNAPEHKILCRSQSEAARTYGINVSQLCGVLQQRKRKSGNTIRTAAGYGAAWANAE